MIPLSNVTCNYHNKQIGCKYYIHNTRCDIFRGPTLRMLDVLWLASPDTIDLSGDLYIFVGCRLYLPVVFARLLPASKRSGDSAKKYEELKY